MWHRLVGAAPHQLAAWRGLQQAALCAGAAAAAAAAALHHSSPDRPPPATTSPAVSAAQIWLQNQRPAGEAQPEAATSKPRLEEGAAYAVYDAAGQPSSLEHMLASLPGYDVVLLGEYHDDPVAHYLQHAVLQHALASHHVNPGSSGGSSSSSSSSSNSSSSSSSRGRASPRPVVLSLEMFETDVQCVMDEYLAGAWTYGPRTRLPACRPLRRPAPRLCMLLRKSPSYRSARGRKTPTSNLPQPPPQPCASETGGKALIDPAWTHPPTFPPSGSIPEADLLKDGRPWPNYVADYRPLVQLAKQYGAHVACANAPRRSVGGRLDAPYSTARAPRVPACATCMQSGCRPDAAAPMLHTHAPGNRNIT